ncbi:hypothetical protein [Mobiluncus mulieris]|uniref:hypothetical protein n=1 Tax=Mobiluncus mulieris TaxID=2052 RepID=UPI001B8CC92D|nr:hypothetical protein [Mobiluncus mulieris]
MFGFAPHVVDSINHGLCPEPSRVHTRDGSLLAIRPAPRLAPHEPGDHPTGHPRDPAPRHPKTSAAARASFGVIWP